MENIPFAHGALFSSQAIGSADVDGFVLHQHIAFVFEYKGAFEVFLAVFASDEATVDRVGVHFRKTCQNAFQRVAIAVSSPLLEQIQVHALSPLNHTFKRSLCICI